MDRQRFRLGIVATAAWAGVSVPVRPGAQQLEDAIRSITVTESVVEITLFSSRGFPVRDQQEILRIGEHEFFHDRHGAGGDLHTLVYALTPGEFAETAPQDLVVVQYGRGGYADRREFGPLGTPR